ncbi:hypothetical protein FZEAL_2646 [Fusarium zealandicum]|uniref:tyrosinase n=1 Tax=Fusarium zealandicum TaxID=1053134 RepID=A0A8H4UR38_9HYPO|nr:hypothetical protein FZEAL_2646 [Fusarium zealandicum]
MHLEVYGIKGLPRPADAITRTYKQDDTHQGIPYVEKLPVRREISALANSTDPDHRRQWTLFVLALERFKLKPVEQKLSYFQIAGIHGSPETSWDGAPPPRQNPENPGPGDQPYGGYCNHNGLNFPTWHRPYMALFEQCIWDNMKDVIDHWLTNHSLPVEEADRWTASKDKWRMPYWDWARAQSYAEEVTYPQVLVEGSVRIFPPDAVKAYYPPSGLYANPLWSFENPEKDEDGNPLVFGKMPVGKRDYNIEDNPVIHDPTPPQKENDKQWMPWSLTSGTSRYGIFVDPTEQRFKGLSGVNNSWEAKKQFSNMTWEAITDKQKNDPCFKWSLGTLADAVNRMFSEQYHSTWGQFASTKWVKEQQGDGKTGFISLEYIHNNVHDFVGGSDYKTGVGHMSDVPVAAFDPLFWLHHAQIDRLLAMWQCLNWDSWFNDPEPGKGNAPDDKPDDYLYPFHDVENGTEDDYCTANKCRDWTVLNYQYDDLMDLSRSALNKDKTLNESKFKCLLRAYIHKIYPTTQHLLDDIDHTFGFHIPKGLRPGSSDKAWYDYIINVVYDRYALDGRSYTIKFYLGNPKDQEETHFDPRNLVGSVYTFGGGVRRTQESCANCKTQADNHVLSCAQVPLTTQLVHLAVDRARTHSVNSFTDIETYLKDHLCWRFVGFGGVEIEDTEALELFPETKITVLRGAGEPRDETVPNESGLTKSLYVSYLLSSSGGMLEAGTASMEGKGADEAPKVAVPPAYQNYQALPGITDGKPFGLKVSEGQSEGIL